MENAHDDGFAMPAITKEEVQTTFKPGVLLHDVNDRDIMLVTCKRCGCAVLHTGDKVTDGTLRHYVSHAERPLDMR